MFDIQKEISRTGFLGLALKIFAIFSFSSFGAGCNRNAKAPNLRGISEDDYFNFHALGEIFLEGNPIKEFDIGKSLDDYLYGHPYPLPTIKIVHELAEVPSSYLAALALDFSFTPLAKLSKEDRLKRLNSWRDSSSAMKRGAYSIMKQFCYFLLSSNKDYQKYVGYEG